MYVCMYVCVKWTTLSSHSLKRLKFTDFVRRTQIINLPLLYETSYASQASFCCCNFSHILNRYDPHRSPPCFRGLFVEERLSSKYKPISFPGSSLFLPLTKHLLRTMIMWCCSFGPGQPQWRVSSRQVLYITALLYRTT